MPNFNRDTNVKFCAHVILRTYDVSLGNGGLWILLAEAMNLQVP